MSETYLPEYKYNDKHMSALIKALIAVDFLESYFEDSFFDEIMYITINLLKELSNLLKRNVEADQPYSFKYENQILFVYNYIPEEHNDINLIYSIVDIPKEI